MSLSLFQFHYSHQASTKKEGPLILAYFTTPLMILLLIIACGLRSKYCASLIMLLVSSTFHYEAAQLTKSVIS